VLRDDEDMASRIDRLLDPKRLPWFLQRPGGTGGWLDDEQRARLAGAMEALGPALPDEVNAFVEAFGGMDADPLVHDRLSERTDRRQHNRARARRCVEGASPKTSTSTSTSTSLLKGSANLPVCGRLWYREDMDVPFEESLGGFLDFLASERRASPHTVAAYR